MQEDHYERVKGRGEAKKRSNKGARGRGVGISIARDEGRHKSNNKQGKKDKIRRRKSERDE